jgi:hypothetical protein
MSADIALRSALKAKRPVHNFALPAFAWGEERTFLGERLGDETYDLLAAAYEGANQINHIANLALASEQDFTDEQLESLRAWELLLIAGRKAADAELKRIGK